MRYVYRQLIAQVTVMAIVNVRDYNVNLYIHEINDYVVIFF